MAIRTSTERRLLDAAEELFFAHGVAATPVDAVLARAGVSAATLYRGYPTKEDLLAAALERRHDAWVQAWEEAVAAAGTAEERLLAVLDALETFPRGRPGSRWCAFLGAAAEHEDPPPALAAALDRETTTLRTRLRALAHDVDPGRAEALAEQLLLVVSGHLAMRLRSPGRSAEVARDVATVLVRNG
jgi:AcrR family transcriptional regulator